MLLLLDTLAIQLYNDSYAHFLICWELTHKNIFDWYIKGQNIF